MTTLNPTTAISYHTHAPRFNGEKYACEAWYGSFRVVGVGVTAMSAKVDAIWQMQELISKSESLAAIAPAGVTGGPVCF